MKQVLDFIVVGAQKSGTTSLFEYLCRHPDLCLPPSKEAPYFNNNDRYSSDWGEYLENTLPHADPSCQWGTVTPQYMNGGASGAGDERTVPLRIRERLPDVRLIAILRDPVQRARSHHGMAVIDGWDTRSFDVAVRELLQPEVLVRSRRQLSEITGYVVFGEYGRILAGYLDVFPREQLLVLFTSELKDDPHGVLHRVFQFLGVDPEFVPDNLDTRYHESGTAYRMRWLDLYRLQVAASSSPLLRSGWHALPERARRRVQTEYGRLNYRTRVWNRRGWNRRESAPATERESETDRMLREHFRADAELLTELFGVTPPWVSARSAAGVAGPA